MDELDKARRARGTPGELPWGAVGGNCPCALIVQELRDNNRGVDLKVARSFLTLLKGDFSFP